MTPERIQELRDWFPFDSSIGGYTYDQMPEPKHPFDTLTHNWHDMLDEIEILTYLVALHRGAPLPKRPSKVSNYEA